MRTKIICTNVFLLNFICPIVIADDTKTTENLETIEVFEEKQDQQNIVQLLPEQAKGLIDTADVLKKIPGANVNRNGRLTGIAQYRGLFGERVNINVDGFKISEAGPNSMDASMSYVPSNMVDAVILKRGITPVSSAIESIGGNITVLSKGFDQSLSQKPHLKTDFSFGFSSVDSGKNASTFISGSSDAHQAYVGVDYNNGDSYKFNNGENFNSQYDRKFYQAGYQFKHRQQSISLKTTYNDTGKTGTPALPMDIIYVRGGTINGQYNLRTYNDIDITANLGYQNADHKMNNFQFRSTGNRLQSITSLVARSYGIKTRFLTSLGTVHLGFAGDESAHQADIFNEDNANFLIENLNTTKQRNSLFAELSNSLTGDWSFNAGVRITRVRTDAKDVSSTVAMLDNPMGNLHRTLRDRFNTSDRNQSDFNVDAAIDLRHRLNEKITLNYGLGLKNRAPSHIERYLWLPLEATGGLADGFRYFGNIQLKSEQAKQLEIGLSFDDGTLSFSPQIYYHDIGDYIQGTPTTIAPIVANTLTFNNVDAKIYGFDYELKYRINDQFNIRNNSSYVRGKRTDINDNLYRIAPLNTSMAINYEHKPWQLGLELVVYKAQNKVSATNQERKTPGFGILNVSGTYTFGDHSQLAFGMNNLLDKKYFDHLGGYNRNNLNTDVGFNATDIRANRLPGLGTNLYATWYLNW